MPMLPSACSEFRLGEPFADASLDALDLFRSKQAPLHPAANAVQEFQPVLQRWLLQLLPLVEPPLAAVKNPLIANVMGIDLKLLALLRGVDLTDFCFGHGV